MDERIKELIAIGASVGSHCQPCLAWHLEKARELDVADDDIQAAVEVGFMVEKGAADAMRKYALEAAGQPEQDQGPCCSAGGLEVGKCCG